MVDVFDTIAAAAHEVTALKRGIEQQPAAVFRELPDADLEESMRTLARLRHQVDLLTGFASGEVHRRSQRGAGYGGLAQGRGQVNAQKLIQALTGTSKAEAGRFVRLGTMLNEAADSRADVAGWPDAGSASPLIDPATGKLLLDPSAPPLVDPVTGELLEGDALLDPEPAEPPWHQVITAAVIAGELSPAAGTALREGLGEPTDTCPTHVLRDAATDLLRTMTSPATGTAGATAGVTTDSNTDPGSSNDSPSTETCTMTGTGTGKTLARITPEQAWKTGRLERDLLDREGIAEREAALIARRALRVWKDRDGMLHLHGIIDPEPGDEIHQAITHALGPRVGAPRFVDKDTTNREKALLEDPRTNEQIAADTLIALIKAGIDTDTMHVPGGNRASVRIIIPADQLHRPDGTGWIDGTTTTVSHPTIERLTCNTGAIPIIITTTGTPLDVGRDQRLFTRRQRIALAIRDGGCRWPDCNKPPAMTEAHHINHWDQDHGRTDTADGILLCRHHHLLLHNNHWKIHRTPAQSRRPDQPDRPDNYWLTPPTTIDPDQTPIPLPSKSPLDAYTRREHRNAG